MIMKNKLIVVLFYFIPFTHLFGQNNFSFEYNTSGNLTKRKLVIVEPPQRRNFELPSNLLKVFPNPTSDYVTLEGNLPDKCSSANVILTDEKGQLVKKTMYDGTSLTIDLIGVETGLYFLSVEYSDEWKDTYKLIISN